MFLLTLLHFPEATPHSKLNMTIKLSFSAIENYPSVNLFTFSVSIAVTVNQKNTVNGLLIDRQHLMVRLQLRNCVITYT